MTGLKFRCRTSGAWSIDGSCWCQVTLFFTVPEEEKNCSWPDINHRGLYSCINTRSKALESNKKRFDWNSRVACPENQVVLPEYYLFFARIWPFEKSCTPTLPGIHFTGISPCSIATGEGGGGGQYRLLTSMYKSRHFLTLFKPNQWLANNHSKYTE